VPRLEAIAYGLSVMVNRQGWESKFSNDFVIFTTDQAEWIELEKRTLFATTIGAGFSENGVFEDGF
jgi:hypothetical protein